MSMEKLNYKPPKVKIFSLLLIFTVVFTAILLYNQTKGFAQVIPPPPLPTVTPGQEIEKAPELYCNPEIPIGETMADTVALLNALAEEMKKIESEAGKEITEANNLISLANQCNPNECHAVDCGSYDCPYDCPRTAGKRCAEKTEDL